MRGFTLIETLIYIGLLSLITGGCVVSAYAIMSTSARGLVAAHITEEGLYLTKKIDLSLADGESHPITAAGNDLLQDGAVLNGSDTGVTHFVHTTCNADTQCVHVSFALTSTTTDGHSLTRTFETTYYKRN